MTRTIHPDLLAEQKKTVYTPSLSLTIRDNGLAHPVILHDNLANTADNPHTASVTDGTVIVRAHVAGATLYTQRIT
ncbi:MAG TPA: hypothetical protein VLA31_09990, partial [Burkholderiaceae bacterium]|nr:hypothetical protein [Burkholderiaceae bacterium]